MIPANVKLSKNELSLVCDEQFILTKNNIIDKVYTLFGTLSNEFTKELQQFTQIHETAIFQNAPKIYKGEQYKALPYVMLDQPRYFTKEDAFAIRCFFWWGNFFSITLHLSGKYQQLHLPHIIEALQNNTKGWYYCINENQWEHDFGPNNYIVTGKETNLIKKESASKKSFLKIAKKIPLQQWDGVYEFYIKSFKEIMTML